MIRPIVSTAIAAVFGVVIASLALGRGNAAPETLDANADFSHFQNGQGTPGAEVFKSHCAMCHQNGAGAAPPVTVLGLMPPSSIVNALTNGAMRAQGAGLTHEEEVAVAEFLSGKKLAAATQDTAPTCQGTAAALDIREPPVFPGWGLTDAGTHVIAPGVAGLNRANIQHLTLKWAFAFPDATRARSNPALAGGAIFIGSHLGDVYALDREAGCVRWRFRAGAEVRTGVVVSGWKAGDRSARPLVYFGDLVGNVYALNARDGTVVWRAKADPHASTTLTGTPTLFGELLYVPVSSLEEAITDPSYQCCTFRGSVLALNARTGAPVWRTYMTPQATFQGLNDKGAKQFGPSGAPIWNSPSIDVKRHQLYVGTGDNYSSPATPTSDAIVALDLSNGRMKWVFQTRPNDAWNVACGTADKTLCPKENGPDYDIGAGTILASASNGHDYVIAGAKSGDVYAVDADTGKLHWNTKVGRGGVLAGVYFGLAVSGDRVFVPVSDAVDGRPHAEPARPGLYALDLRTGRYLWKRPDAGEGCSGERPQCMPGIAAPVTVTGNLLIAGGTDGWLRIRNARTGAELWRYDMAAPVAAVGGAIAKGGALFGGAEPQAYHGMLIVPSGNGFTGKMPGNALLVFSAK
jgi:polyvinyl alcohol dehydrogenase (cytochrome)